MGQAPAVYPVEGQGCSRWNSRVTARERCSLAEAGSGNTVAQQTSPTSGLERRLALSEDEVDLLEFRLAEIEHVVSGGEFVPGDVVDRLVAGENPIRVWRGHRGLSLRALAREAGISAQLLSDVERGQKEGSLRTLRSLARVLRVNLDDLVAADDDAQKR